MAFYCGLILLGALLGVCSPESIHRVERSAQNWQVTTLEEKPYVIIDNSKTGNAKFTGFIPDMMKRIGEELNQQYTLREVEDKRYGVKGRNGQWNGMIGEVVAARSELAAAPLTISHKREEAVAFTEPFLSFETTILVHKLNGSEKTPTLQDLLARPGMKFGVIKDGSTEQLLEQSDDRDLATLRTKLDKLESQERGVQLVRQSTEGKYGFVIEENTALYWKNQKPCNLESVPIKMLKAREYAFALHKDSTYVQKVSDVIKKMKANNEIEELKDKWWDHGCNGSAKVSLSGIPQTLAFLFSSLLISMTSFRF